LHVVIHVILICIIIVLVFIFVNFITFFINSSIKILIFEKKIFFVAVVLVES
jgi:hypothetical protein